ncbi:transglycosylase domain-containing protein, partial [Pseudomonadales bacterium]|nr:transglycosylase domain-containing protein [Pseudomonadales bacterium]
MKRLLIFVSFGIGMTLSGLGMGLSAAYLYLNPQVPDISTFTEVNLKAPLKILSRDRKLIQEYGERLIPITFEQIPRDFINALLDTEDKRFFEHSGIDLITVANATWQLLANAGDIKTGASTITMQVVKNVSGASEVRFIRKFKEMLLAIKLEQALTKQQILTLYLNIVPFGKHAYGIQAAAQTYYGKPVSALSLAQMAMLAGIPKAPEAGNPINGPKRALARRNLILDRMFEQGSITQTQLQKAQSEQITAKVFERQIELPALYAAELIRSEIIETFGRKAYTLGLEVTATIDSQMQHAAENALIKKLNEYDRRHGYRGPEAAALAGTRTFLANNKTSYPPYWLKTLKDTPIIGDQHPAIVTDIGDREITVLTQSGEAISIDWEQLRWARPYLNVNQRGPQPKSPSSFLSLGDLIRIELRDEGTWRLGQVPSIQGAFVAVDPVDGGIKALVGGYDFNLNQFNHATQAKRQPGSNFKPFFYAGAMEGGVTAASIYNDAPVVLPGGELEEQYRPKNSGSQFRGNIRMREALYRSINLVSLRVLLDYGPDNAIDYVKRFGFNTDGFPRNVQLAFGGGTIALTPLEVAAGYAMFANGGKKVSSYLIASISSINTDDHPALNPQTCTTDCAPDAPEQVMDPRIAFIMNSILKDTIQKGTGRKAFKALDREDLMGKTGTTNDADLWFSG